MVERHTHNNKREIYIYRHHGSDSSKPQIMMVAHIMVVAVAKFGLHYAATHAIAIAPVH